MYLVLWIFLAQRQITPNNRKDNLIFVPTSFLVIVFFSWVFGWYFPLLFGVAAIFGALWILRSGGKILGNYWGSALVVTILCLFMVTYVLRYLPIKDYRAYAIGENLVDNMNDGVAGVYQSLLVYKNKNSGESVEYDSSSDEYIASKIWEDADWEYVSMVQKEIVATRIPSITAQFSPFISINDISENELQLSDVQEQIDAAKIEGIRLKDLAGNYELDVVLSEYNSDDYPMENYTILDTITMMDPNISEVTIRDFIVQAPIMVLVSSKTLNDADWRYIDRLKEIHETCKENDIPFAVMCGASRDEINIFRNKHKFFAPFFVNDETEMKAISRSNPVLMVIENGEMKAKYPFRSTPTNKKFKKTFLK